MTNKILKSLATFLIALSFSTVSTKAADGWEIAIGLKGHDGDIDAVGSETERESRADNKAPAAGIQGDELTHTTHAKGVEVVSGFLEVVGQHGWAGLTVGVDLIPGSATLGSKSRTEDDLDEGQTATSATYTAKAEIEDITTIYFDPTLYVGDTGFGLYGRFGGTTMMLNTLETLESGVNSSSYPNERMFGLVQGYGVKYKHSSGFLIKLEYAETNFKNITLDSVTGNKNRIEADLDYEETAIAIGWQF